MMKIGFSTKSITPQGVVALGGSSFEKLTDRVRDPISVTAMALEGAEGSEQAVLVSCDLLYIPDEIRDNIIAAVRQRVQGLNPELVVLLTSHSHNVPLIKEPYWVTLGFERSSSSALSTEQFIELVVTRTAEAVEEAWSSRTSGALSWEQGYAVLGHNRRVLYDDGTAKMFGSVNTPHFLRLDGPVDHRVELLFAWDEERKLKGILYNVACTSQFLSDNVISADMFGEVRKQAADKWGPDVFVLGMLGAAGDLHPREVLHLHSHKHEPDAVLRKTIAPLIRTIEDALESAKDQIDAEPAFKHRVRDVSLPLRRVGKSEAEQAEKSWEQFQQWLSQQEDRKAAFQTFLKFSFDAKFDTINHFAVLKRAERMKTDPFFNMKLHSLRIGNTAIVTNPFELYAEYGLQIKARSKAKQTFIAQLTSGWGGYLPTAGAIQSGGYSTRIHSGFVGDDGGRLLVEHTLQAIHELWQ